MLVSPPVSGHAQTPELSADAPIAYSEETGLLIASDNAVYTDENTTVEADEIRYNRERERIEARGNVRVTREGIRLLAEELIYDAREKTFSATRFRAGYPPLFIEGEAFSGDLDEVAFEDISLYFREPVAEAPELSMRAGRWVADEFLEGSGLSIRTFGGLSVPLPGFTYAFGQPTIDIDASLGYRDNLGLYGQSHWLYPLTRGLSLGANTDFYTERGILIGPAAEWRSSDSLWKAFLNTGWIHDHSSLERGFDILENRIEQDRGFADAGLSGRSPDGSLQFQARGTYLSDSEVRRDFREDDYFQTYHPDTWAEFTWQRDALLLSTFARSRINDGYAVIERLPEVHLEWLPSPVADSGFFIQAQATATRYRQYFPLLPGIAFPGGPLGLAPNTAPDFSPPPPPDGTPPEPPRDFIDQIPPWNPSAPEPPAEAQSPAIPTVLGDLHNRLMGSFALTRPMALPNGVNLVLRAGSRWDSYRREGGGLSGDRLAGELGFDLSQSLARTYTVNWERFGIERLRHQSTLLLKYRWHELDGDQAIHYLGYDANQYRSLAPVLDLSDLSHLDHPRDWNVARFGWEHRLYATGGDADSRRILRLHLYQDLRFDAPPGRDEWDALYTEMEFTPAPWLGILWLQKYRPEDLRTEASFLRATLRSADLWSLSLQTEFLETAIEQYALDGRYRLTENLGLLGYWQYDARLNNWTRQRYGISRRFGNVWQLEAYITLTDEDQRRDDFSVGLRLRWLSF
jgi:LPS-assembly protein